MKILFGTKFFGQDTSEVPSGFLVWIIEEYENCDYTLRKACQSELAHRLKIDLGFAQAEELPFNEMKKLKRDILKAQKENEFLFQLCIIHGISGGEFAKYSAIPGLLAEAIKEYKENKVIRLPALFANAPFYTEYLQREREKFFKQRERLDQCKSLADLESLYGKTIKEIISDIAY